MKGVEDYSSRSSQEFAISLRTCASWCGIRASPQPVCGRRGDPLGSHKKGGRGSRMCCWSPSGPWHINGWRSQHKWSILGKTSCHGRKFLNLHCDVSVEAVLTHRRGVSRKVRALPEASLLGSWHTAGTGDWWQLNSKSQWQKVVVNSLETLIAFLHVITDQKVW